MEVEVRAALEKFRRGDDETAFFELIEMPGDALPASLMSSTPSPVPTFGLS